MILLCVVTIIIILVFLLYIIAFCIEPNRNVTDAFIYGTWVDKDDNILTIEEGEEYDKITVAVKNEDSYKIIKSECDITKRNKLSGIIPGKTVNEFDVCADIYNMTLIAYPEEGIINVKKGGYNLGFFAKNSFGILKYL